MGTSLQVAIDEIRKAFPSHPLDPDRAFGGNGTTYLNAETFEEGVRGKSWDMLDAEFLDFHHDALVFLSPEAFVEYLPAFLTAFLEKGHELNGLPTFLRGVLTRGSDTARFDARIGRLTPEQKIVVARALAALEEAEEFEHNKSRSQNLLTAGSIYDLHWLCTHDTPMFPTTSGTSYHRSFPSQPRARAAVGRGSPTA